jgi:hypothetical protein
MERCGRASAATLHSVDATKRFSANHSIPLQRFRMLKRLNRRT